MANLKKYEGIIPAFYACYDKEGKIDTAAVRGLTRWFIEKGVTGLYVGGIDLAFLIVAGIEGGNNALVFFQISHFVYSLKFVFVICAILNLYLPMAPQ